MINVLVTGDRNWTNKELIEQALQASVGHIWASTPEPVPEATVIQGGNGYLSSRLPERPWELITHIDDLPRAERGADALAFQAALGLGFNVETFMADWRNDGRSAGPKRNSKMLAELLKRDGPKLVLAFHNNLAASKGTLDMMTKAHAAGIKVLLCDHDDPFGLPWRPQDA